MRYIIFSTLLFLSIACQEATVNTGDKETVRKADLKYEETFRHDLDLLRKHEDVVVLEMDSMKVLVVPGYQARVMTSSSRGLDGPGYGWINHALIDSGEYVPHINAYGGEERFWLGPEGGQFALFFEKGKPFDFENWQTPAVLDTVSFDLIQKQSDAAAFTKTFSIQNYSGTDFRVTVNREIKLLEKAVAEKMLGLSFKELDWVGYQTTNTMVNAGDEDWSKEKGVLSIWLLSMMKASPRNTMIVPYKSGGADLVNDAYFGTVSAERLKKKDSFLLFTADSKSRGKIGISPEIVKPFMGSYDALRNVLTIIGFDYHGDTSYVNSIWEIQDKPYNGDVVNAYNDGPNDTGSQLGAFYELESSSPAVPLKKGEMLTHVQRIFHFEGSREQLARISLKLLGTDLDNL